LLLPGEEAATHPPERRKRVLEPPGLSAAALVRSA